MAYRSTRASPSAAAVRPQVRLASAAASFVLAFALAGGRTRGLGPATWAAMPLPEARRMVLLTVVTGSFWRETNGGRGGRSGSGDEAEEGGRKGLI